MSTDVDMVPGRYGEFKVQVDGNTIVDGGAASFLGLLPSADKVVSAVRERLAG